jgi:hypothetical protein
MATSKRRGRHGGLCAICHGADEASNPLRASGAGNDKKMVERWSKHFTTISDNWVIGGLRWNHKLAVCGLCHVSGPELEAIPDHVAKVVAAQDKCEPKPPPPCTAVVAHTSSSSSSSSSLVWCSHVDLSSGIETRPSPSEKRVKPEMEPPFPRQVAATRELTYGGALPSMSGSLSELAAVLPRAAPPAEHPTALVHVAAPNLELVLHGGSSCPFLAEQDREELQAYGWEAADFLAVHSAMVNLAHREDTREELLSRFEISASAIDLTRQQQTTNQVHAKRAHAVALQRGVKGRELASVAPLSDAVLAKLRERASAVISFTVAADDDRWVLACGSPRDDCLAHTAKIKCAGIDHLFGGERGTRRRRGRSASGIQVAYSRIRAALDAIAEQQLMGMARVRALSAQTKTYILFWIVLGCAMHDVEAYGWLAPRSRELASINGVGGSNWQPGRGRAWLDHNMVLLDAAFCGADCTHKKPEIAVAHGYECFFDMILAHAPLLQALLKASKLRRVRLDVASAGFILVWSITLERISLHTILKQSIDELKTLSRETDYFYACTKLVVSFIVVKPDGGYMNMGANSLKLAGILVLMRVETSFGIFFVERVYEVVGGPPIHLAGSHLPINMIALMIPGADEAAKEAELRYRRATSMALLEQMARLEESSYESALGLRELSDERDARAVGDSEKLAAWRRRSNIKWTPFELRDEYDRVLAAALAEDDEGRYSKLLLTGPSDVDDEDEKTEVGDDFEIAETASAGPRRCSRFC